MAQRYCMGPLLLGLSNSENEKATEVALVQKGGSGLRNLQAAAGQVASQAA